MKTKSAGFSLLELLVGMVIVTIGLSAAIPSYLRNMRQGEVDRYTQQLEAGFFWPARQARPAKNQLHIELRHKWAQQFRRTR